jgi:SAM-dependent methyltransferase
MPIMRDVSEGFGADAHRYHRARPDYPSALVQRVIAASPGKDVLDVGIGTSIAAALFRQAGCTVLGVEPDERMAALAREAGLAVEVARFEEWNPAARTFSAVIAAQAWHWVDMAAGAAKAAEALAPGGLLAIFWNSFLPPSEVNEAISEVYRKALPDIPMLASGMPGPDGYRRLCDQAAEGMTATGSFGEPEHWRFDWERSYTTAEWLDVVPTFGGWSRTPAGKQQEILAGMAAAVDAFGGAFTMGYATVAVAASGL